jgi:hypothetical protein
MFQVTVEWLDEGKSRARFSLPGREEWKVEHIDVLMQLLGDIRQQMTPAVPDEPPQLNEIHFLHAPRYRTVLHEFSGGTLMQFRHPSLGWLPFLLPSLERRRISEYFHSQEVEWEHRHPPMGGSP